MTVYARQKPWLLSQGITIPVRSVGTGRKRQDQLKVWLPVEGYDPATGDVTTRAGIWRDTDLEFHNPHKEAHGKPQSDTHRSLKARPAVQLLRSIKSLFRVR